MDKNKFKEILELSLVIMISSIRVLFSLTSVHNLVRHHMDVKTAFLNGELEDEIDMDQPKGCMVPGEEQQVCRNHFMG